MRLAGIAKQYLCMSIWDMDKSRQYWTDWLRVSIILTLIVYHTSLTFSALGRIIGTRNKIHILHRNDKIAPTGPDCMKQGTR